MAARGMTAARVLASPRGAACLPFAAAAGDGPSGPPLPRAGGGEGGDGDGDGQAASLRGMRGGEVVPLRPNGSGPVRVLAVTSGKGGVGKTSISANLAVALARRGRRVLAVDADLGLANLDLVLGVTPRFTLLHVLRGERPIGEVLVPGPCGLSLLAACSGRYEIANLGATERQALFSSIDSLEDRFDVLIVDTGAGLGSNALAFAAAAQDVLVVVTPEPTSIADAYAVTKVLHRRFGVARVRVLANMVASPREGDEVYGHIARLAERFLHVGLDYAGCVVRDDTVGRAVREGEPLIVRWPQSPAAASITALARRLIEEPPPDLAAGSIRLFWKRLCQPDAPRPGSEAAPVVPR